MIACRHGVAVALVLAVVACTPRVEPAGPPVAAASLHDGHVLARDGAKLPLRRWLPASRTRASIIALHGFNDYSRAFEAPAAYLAKRGIAIYAYDQRGFGAAPHPGIWAGTESLVADVGVVAGLVRRRHPGVPIYLMGESMGGAVALLAVGGAKPVRVDGTILVAPAVWGRRHMGFIPRAALWFFSNTMPWLPLSGQGLEIEPSDNIPMLRKLSRDPLIIKETRVDAVLGLVNLMDAALVATDRLKGPALILYGQNEQVLPKEPVREMLRRLSRNAKVRNALYEGGYHMLLRDLGANKVLDDIVAWIAARGAPLPSGADTAAAAFVAEDKSETVR